MATMEFIFALFTSCILLAMANGQSLGDTLVQGQFMNETQTLDSLNKKFHLGFFTLNSSNQYLGIWYIDPSTIVWVANGDSPAIGGNSTLVLSNGILSIQNGTGDTIWFRGKQTPKTSPICHLGDVGTLFILDKSTNDTLWQSSSELSNTLLPTVYLGYVQLLNLDLKMQLVSWKNSTDPSPGNFVYKLDPLRLSELVITFNSSVTFRTGPWNGNRWNGLPTKGEENLLRFQFKSGSGGSYFWYDTLNPAYFLRLVMNPKGFLQFLSRNTTSDWEEFETIPPKGSSTYVRCGPFGISDGSNCTYLEGFVPKSLDDWKQGNFSDGLVRSQPLDCVARPIFTKVKNVKLPDTLYAGVNSSILSLDGCQKGCSMNCSCTAFTILGSQGCLVWFGDLFDMEKLAGDSGDDLYIRVSAPPPPPPPPPPTPKHNSDHSTMKKIVKILTYVAMPGGLILLLACVFLSMKVYKWRSQRIDRLPPPYTNMRNGPNGQEDLRKFDYNTLKVATNDFNEQNKLGEGQFGSVYKAILHDGEEIAVKKIRRNSTQGINNAEKEVSLLGKLRHQNLVKLLGYCEHGDEMLLCYESLPQRSLDKLLFEGNSPPNWPTRYRILQGIAAGLLYLHEDCGSVIIHRDLKPSNVLLDRDMVPKISDFGLARLFETNGWFVKLASFGRLGHRAPELQRKIISTTADVYSFGILILEIVTGRENSLFPNGLISFVLQCWNEGRVNETVDNRLNQPYPMEDVQRCVHIALLCLLEQSEMRPKMRDINRMLTSKTSGLPNVPINCLYWGLDFVDTTKRADSSRLF